MKYPAATTLLAFAAAASVGRAGTAPSPEIAWQDKAGPLNDGEGLYAHFHATKAFDAQTLTLGIGHLDAGVQTPLATLHAFNGCADASDAFYESTTRVSVELNYTF